MTDWRADTPKAGTRLRVRVTAALSNTARNRRRGPVRRAALGILDEVRGQLPELPGLPHPSSWRLLRVVNTDTDVTVAMYGVGSEVLVVGRVASSPDDRRAVRNSDVLESLWADQRLSSLHSLLPRPLAAGTRNGMTYSVETAIAGVPARSWLRGSRGIGLWDRIDAAASALWTLYEQTSNLVVIDDPLFDGLVSRPVSAVRALAQGNPGHIATLGRLEQELGDTLRGRQAQMSWTHGDYWLGNIIVDGSRDVMGIVDWDAASPVGFASLDVQLLVLTTTSLLHGVDLGGAVVHALREGGDPQSAPLIARAADLSGVEELRSRNFDIVLTWLAHVHAGLLKRRDRSVDRRWLDKNVWDVLDQLSVTLGA